MEGSVAIARKVLKTKGAVVVSPKGEVTSWVDSPKNAKGILLDLQTANAIVTVADALSPENRRKLDKLPIERAASVAWKLVS